MGRWDRWKAATEIVKSFNANGSPGFALAALFVIIALPPAIVIIGSLLGIAKIPWKLFG